MRRKFSSHSKVGFRVVVLAAVASAGLMAASQASAGIIYQDNFARGSTKTPLALNLSTPSPTDTAKETWLVSTSTSGDINTILTTNGSGAYVVQPSSQQSPVAYLAGLAPLTDVGIYTLSATLQPSASTSTNWLSLGFGNTSAGSNPEGSNAWLLYRADGGTQSFYGNTGTSNLANGGTGTSGAADTFTITLNSATGAVAFSDTDGLVSRTGTLSSTNLGDINALMLGSLGVNGSFKDVTLTYSAVPEPATLGLIALGGLGILLVGKRRRLA